MLARTIGQAAAVAGFILSGVVAWAQTDQKPAVPDAMRQGVAQGAAFCKAHLASAPADLKLGEVEEFCTCMGVNEYAMQDMTNEAKASLRPRQQQMCMEIVRKQGQAPAPAATPAAPPSPPPAPPVTAEQPAANAPGPVAASQPPAVEQIEQWSITSNASGAPVAFARATDSTSVAAFMMFCRAKDAVGWRVRYKSGFNEKKVGFSIAGWDYDFRTDANGIAVQKDWADFLQHWRTIDNPQVRKQPGYSGVMDIYASNRVIGKTNIDGLPEAHARMRSLCAEAIAKGTPAGNYLSTGLVGFDPEVIVGAAPNGTPSGVSVVAPRVPQQQAPSPKAAAPRVAKPDNCAARVKNQLAANHQWRNARMGGGLSRQEFGRRVCLYSGEYLRKVEQSARAIEACPSFVRTQHENPAALRSFARSYANLASAFDC